MRGVRGIPGVGVHPRDDQVNEVIAREIDSGIDQVDDVGKELQGIRRHSRPRHPVRFKPPRSAHPPRMHVDRQPHPTARYVFEIVDHGRHVDLVDLRRRLGRGCILEVHEQHERANLTTRTQEDRIVGRALVQPRRRTGAQVQRCRRHRPRVHLRDGNRRTRLDRL